MAVRVTLSAQLSDQQHGRPVVQGLKALATGVNDHDAQLQALIARVGAIHVPTLDQIKAALQASGSAPLNITALVPGTAPGGSGSVIVYGTHGDRLAVDLTATPVGTLFIETDRYALYELTATGWLFLGNVLGPYTGTIFSADQRPGDLGSADIGFIFEGSDANGAWWRWSGSAWVFQIGTGVPIEVTLNPSTKPTLTVHDAGFGIWATDYHRFYLWNGGAWVEGEHNDARYQIGMFNATPDQQGWFKCDGSTVKQSLTTAGIADYVTPDLISAGQFLRSAAGAGGTGGSAAGHHHSVDPPSTVSSGPTPNTSGTPSATVTVDNNGGGSTVNVGDATHTHDLGAHTHTTDIASFNSGDTVVLPPYYELVPYIRL